MPRGRPPGHKLPPSPDPKVNAHRARNARYRAKHPARVRASMLDRYYRKKEKQRHDPRIRALALQGFSIVTASTLRAPRLSYIDTNGRVWFEDTRSAQQLIDDFEKGKWK